MIPKKFSIEEIKNYLKKQDSLGDAHFNLTEENIIADNSDDAINPEEWLKEHFNLELNDLIETGPFNYMGRAVVAILPADGKGHFRTEYPFVLSLSTRNELENMEKVTIESIFGY